MATLTVKQSGGDYTTLAAALSAAAASDIIEISGAWTVDDTSVATVADNDVTIQAIGDSKHPGYTVASPSHYRLRCASNGSHCITVNNTGCVIDGLEIRQGSTGSSDECIRIGAAITVTVKNSLLWSNTTTGNQDGIYQGNVAATVNVENCILWSFMRAGLHCQNFSGGSGAATWNINSCTIFNCGGEAAGGGIKAGRDTLTVSVNVFNAVVVDSHAGSTSADFMSAGTVTWNIDYCIDSDGSIASLDGGAVGSLASRTATDSASPGTGDWVVFEDITTSPYDLRVQDNAENDAQDMHASSTGAGLTIPSTDAIGVSRPQNTNYDCGAFEFSSGGGSALTLDIADSIALSDVPASEPRTAYTETITMSEALAKAFFPGALVEILTLADVTAKESQIAKADAITLAEALANESQISKADALVLAEALVKDTSKPLADALTVADALTKDVTLAALVETLTMGDSVATAIVLILEIADAITLADARTVEAQLAKADAVTITEAVAKHVALGTLVDGISVSDSVATAIVLILELADALSLSDAGTRQLGKVVADGIALADDAFKTASAIFGDELTLADVLATVRELSVSVSDSIALGDLTVTDIVAVAAAVRSWRARRRDTIFEARRRETNFTGRPA